MHFVAVVTGNAAWGGSQVAGRNACATIASDVADEQRVDASDAADGRGVDVTSNAA
jgi:hypothetical protein